MELAALAIQAFGVGSLAVAFTKYTLEKRKAAEPDHAKNTLRRF